jgi:hypothetical protein
VDAMTELRVWLDLNNCVPVSFDICKEPHHRVLVRVVFAEDHIANAFKREFARWWLAPLYWTDLSPIDLTSPPNASAQARASLSILNSRRHVTVSSSVMHRNTSGSKRWLSSHSLMRDMIVDSPSRSHRITTAYNIRVFYSVFS